MNEKMNEETTTTTAPETEVKPSSKLTSLDTFFGSTGLALESFNQYSYGLRQRHPIWGTIATPLYMYYGTMMSPFASPLYRNDYKRYVDAYAKDETADVECAPSFTHVRCYGEDKQRPRLSPTPKNMKTVGIVTTILSALLILAAFKGNDNGDGE